MKTAITIALLLIVDQAIAGEQVISVQHDSQRGVTCWVLNNTGISCLPDSTLQTRANTTLPSKAGGVSPTSSAPERELSGTTPNPGEERLQL